MPIPDNLTKEHLLEAIEKIDREGIPANGNSTYYDLIYKEKRYPPKLVISYANFFANGIELDRNSFSGGLKSTCFRLLKRNGFTIIKKDKNERSDFFNELKNFLDQAETNNLTTSQYIKKFLDLSVKVSFGQGNQSKIPWIAFLSELDTVQNGIYPVYLYYKQKKLLILAYGLSETHHSNRSWNLEDLGTISQYFADNNLGKPERYGTSFVYETYDIEKGIDEEKINSDLTDLIDIYKSTFIKPESTILSKPKSNTFRHQSFSERAAQSGLFLNDGLNIRFIASLLTKPFVILTGLSGSGKTKLAQAFAMWICESENQFCLVPVGADWTNREPLLGFPNALENNKYVKPDNRALDLIIEANKSDNADKPFFLILDEMNLSHVERYFADFLSVMESDSKIYLHSGDKDWEGVPQTIGFPKNLFIIGTVNIDETTYMFSPKVLDRANVIEFRVTAEEMTSYLLSGSILNLKALKKGGANSAVKFVEIAKDQTLASKDSKELSKALLIFFEELKKIGAEFGYRTASEIRRFTAVINKIEPTWSATEIIDAAIMQKLLPKVHGSRRKLEPVLKTLGTLCLKDGNKFDDYLSQMSKSTVTEAVIVKYPISFEKIQRMYNNLISNGFTSYAEA